MSSNYLFELGTEELPPKSLLTLSNALGDAIKASLAEHKLGFSEFKLLCSPRRLAFVVSDLDDKTPTSEQKVWGPPAKIAFDADNQPTKAALAFCKRNNINADQIVVESDGKVDKVACTVTQGGEDTSELLPECISSALNKLPIAKRMRWGSGRTEFVRPVHWVVLMKNEHVVPATILGQTSGRITRGHRFLCDADIDIQSAQSYETQLFETGKVIADFSVRRDRIRDQVKQESLTLGGTAVIEDDLLDEVCALVEWPVAVSGKFDEAFLSVPAEALISSMKEHQKYFHIVNTKGDLVPAFITVSNIEASDYSSIKTGNEKVIRPRLADAAFFFETDKKQSLEERREKLKTVVFQSKLGSIFDKTERIKKLAVFIADKLSIDNESVSRCSELCKSDLVSNMVYEFPEMQGIAGYHYALNDGERSDIASGITEHYQPKYAGDDIPASDVGAIVGLADRIDTLTGIFGIGLIPTGSKDPFGLRRASVSTLRIIVEKDYGLDLADVLAFSLSLHSDLSDESNSLALNYILDRFKAWYEDSGIPAQVFQSVSAKSLTTPLDIHQRVHAVAAFYKTDDAIALAAANKRVANILAKNDGPEDTLVDTSVLSETAEKELYSQLSKVSKDVAPLLEKREYEAALEMLSTLRSVVDTFFDDVMVMADDPAVKRNRLALLSQLRGLFLHIADIRFLAPGKDA